MKQNMNMFDAIIRYALLMITVIIGGALGSLPLMLLGMPFFFSAILGWCPIYHVLGIDRHTANMN